MPSNPETSSPQTQKQRWLRYGANVAISSLIVIALAVAITYAAQQAHRRVDTTALGLYSLKPQSGSILNSLNQKVTIVSLYEREKSRQAELTAEKTGMSISEQAQIVSDLLQEYRGKSANISVEEIDPVTSPAKVDQLIQKVTQLYGGEVDKYKAFSTSFSPKYDAIAKLASAEIEKIRLLPLDKLQTSEELSQTVGLAVLSVQEFPPQLKSAQEKVARRLQQKPPDYKGVSDSVAEAMDTLSTVLDKVVLQFQKFKDDKSVPEEFRKYMADSLPRYQEMKGIADDLLKQTKNLGELKLDTLRDALKQKNSILVMGQKEWRIIPYEKVWHADMRDTEKFAREGKIRPRFAGEQAISTAILSLEQPKKQKVVFVRAGGPPVADPGFPPFQPGGQLSSVAERLRDYNYEVVEKDLTGMWAAQAQSQGMPAAPEPTDAEIKDAVWVALALGEGRNAMGGPPPPTIAGKLKAHLDEGGAALILTAPRGEELSAVLDDWGIEVHTDALAVHELVNSDASTANVIEEAKKSPIVFEMRDWGDSPVTRQLRSLSGIMAQACVVTITGNLPSGETRWSILPVPGAPTFPNSWGETNLQSIEGEPKFDAGRDIPQPLYAGAAAEKNRTRLVVVGTPTFFLGAAGEPMRGIVDFPDPELLKRGIRAARFPGNSELFMNSIFWLSHQDALIEISPAAMDVSRISDMSQRALSFWRYGVLLVLLPGLVAAAGIWMYFARRD